MATFTKKFHHNSYPAISPSSPLNSHQGDTILITGSSAGIGLATAKAFIVSGATRVIILSRQQSLLSPALQYLEESRPLDSTTEVLGRQVSITNKESIARLWKDLNTDGINVNILVLNAAKTGHSPILAMGSSNTWEYFETNVLSSLLMTEHFMNQAPEVPKVLINVASFLAHVLPANGSGGYATSKAAGSFMLQTLADETPVSTMQIISLHPGSIFSDAAKAAGYKEDSIPWDNGESRPTDALNAVLDSGR